jgi:hypothetical protein
MKQTPFAQIISTQLALLFSIGSSSQAQGNSKLPRRSGTHTQISGENRMTTGEILDNQAEAICRLFDDADRALSVYKGTRSRVDSERFDQILVQIATKWQQMTATYEQLDDQLPNKQQVLQRLKIDKDGALSKLHWYKSFVNGGFGREYSEARAAKMAEGPKKVSQAVRSELALLLPHAKTN